MERDKKCRATLLPIMMLRTKKAITHIFQPSAQQLAHQGKILVAGPNSTPVEGDPGGVTVVLEFPSREALEGWYNSSEYQEILNLRLDNT